MTLEEKIKRINIVDSDSKLISMETNSKIKIKNFWADFIEPRLPDPDVVKAWSKLLVDYVNEDDAVFAIRAFFNRNKKHNESKTDDELRRGFLTIPNNASFSYFFTDNSFAAYFHKMVLDGYIPSSLGEFKAMMKERLFPAHFGRSCNPERVKAAYKIGSKHIPPIGGYGYKIAHVADACGHYCLNDNDDLAFADLAPLHFPRGKYSHWQYNASLGCYVRTIDILPETRKILTAHFLRFVNPFNHFLAPKAKNTNTSKKTGISTTKIYNKYFNYLKSAEKYDVGEFKPLLDYVNEKFETEIYGDEYIEYKKLLLLPDSFFGTVSGEEVINIEYGNPLFTFTTGKSTSTAASTLSTMPKTAVKKRATTTIKNDNKTLVFKLLNDLADSGKFTPDLILKLSDKRFTQQTFGIPSTYSLLVKESDFTKLGCNSKKYYQPERLTVMGEKYCVCSQWIPERIKKLEEWYDKF